MNGNHECQDFETVKRAELDALKLGAGKGPVVGLAFSGGGIRSATFNLGIVQALARCRLLTRFHYLSTVSGGGYIGSWLSGWVFHEGQRKDVRADEPKLPIERVEHILAQDARIEPRQITWLRNFSNYLTPQVGLLSADTLQGVATFLRNLILTQANLALFLGAVMLLPLALMGAAPYSVPPLASALLAIALFLFANYFVHRGLAGKESGGEVGSAQALAFWWIVVPLTSGRAVLLSLAHDGSRRPGSPLVVGVRARGRGPRVPGLVLRPLGQQAAAHHSVRHLPARSRMRGADRECGSAVAAQLVQGPAARHQAVGRAGGRSAGGSPDLPARGCGSHRNQRPRLHRACARMVGPARWLVARLGVRLAGAHRCAGVCAVPGSLVRGSSWLGWVSPGWFPRSAASSRAPAR